MNPLKGKVVICQVNEYRKREDERVREVKIKQERGHKTKNRRKKRG